MQGMAMCLGCFEAAMRASASRRMVMTTLGQVGAGASLLACTAVPPPVSGTLPTASRWIDTHCHVFNGADLPTHDFVRKVVIGGQSTLGRIATALSDPLTFFFREWTRAQTVTIDEELKLLAEIMGGNPAERELSAEASTDRGHAVTDWVEMLSGSRLGLCDRLYQQHFVKPWASPGNAPLVLLTPSMVDFDSWLVEPKGTFTGTQSKSSPMDEQVMLMAEISMVFARGRRPVLVHPYFGFDPARAVLRRARGASFEEIFRDLRWHISQGNCIGVKIYPPMGFRAINNAALGDEEFPDYLVAQADLPSSTGFGAALDEVLLALYRWAVAWDVPVMAHCSPSQGMNRRYEARANPIHWREVLERDGLRTLRLNLAHFGGLAGVLDPEEDKANADAEGRNRLTWAGTIAEMMAGRRYPNLYADAGYFAAALWGERTKAISELRRLLADPAGDLRKRLMFGTDWSMVGREPGEPDYARALINAVLVNRQDHEFLEDFAWRNAARFLRLTPDSPSWARLKGFYERNKYPEAMERLASFVVA